ncbi:MAG: hypothetical protein WBB36_17410 [Chitinophagales bacterium]
MKTTSVKLIFLSVAVSGILSMNAAAQTSSSSKTKEQKTTTSTDVKKSAPKDAKKEEFTKHLNEIQTKVKDLSAKAATENNAELTTEANKLNTMVNDYKSKLDRYDSTPASQHDQYVQGMEKDWDAINTQHKKVESMYNKLHSNKMEKTTPKEAATPK